MPFTATQELKILEELGYPPNDVVVLRTQMSIAYRQFGEAIVTRTQEILDQLEELSVIETTYAKDASSSLIKADVLEWDSNGRFINLYRKKNDLLEKLSRIFDMPICGGSGYSSTRVIRS